MARTRTGRGSSSAIIGARSLSCASQATGLPDAVRLTRNSAGLPSTSNTNRSPCSSVKRRRIARRSPRPSVRVQFIWRCWWDRGIGGPIATAWGVTSMPDHLHPRSRRSHPVQGHPSQISSRNPSNRCSSPATQRNGSERAQSGCLREVSRQGWAAECRGYSHLLTPIVAEVIFLNTVQKTLTTRLVVDTT